MSLRVHGTAEILGLAGTDLGHTAWKEITQPRVDAFAEAADDQQWIHVDPVRAADGPFGGTIAHGYLTLSLLIPLFNELLEISDVHIGINYGLNKVRFPAPVRVGGKIRAHGQVANARDVPGGAELTVDFTVEVNDGATVEGSVDVEGNAKPACVAQAVFRYYD